jgi:hypothetical protein
MVSPIIFGPHVWRMLHLFGFSYPHKPSEVYQKHMKEMIENLLPILPCPACAMHAAGYLKRNPVNVESRDTLTTWLNTFHNDVNKRLGKRTFTIEESQQSVEAYFIGTDDWSAYPRAEAMRREDHAVIMGLKRSLDVSTHEHTTLDRVWVTVLVISVLLAISTVLTHRLRSSRLLASFHVLLFTLLITLSVYGTIAQ